MKLAGDRIGDDVELPAWARPTMDPKTGKLTRAVRHGQAHPMISPALRISSLRLSEGVFRLIRGAVDHVEIVVAFEVCRIPKSLPTVAQAHASSIVARWVIASH